MKKIGLFYGSGVATAAIVAKIQEAFGDTQIDLISVETARGVDFELYDNLIMGVSTWFDGELPAHWDEIVPELKTLNLIKKKAAIFGLGDQQNYPDNFVDAIGILAKVVEDKGAELVGQTSSEGYHFQQSLAIRDNRFLGLAIDVDNQSNKTDERIRSWVEQLKREFL
jgi:flavodoxin, long chain